jgi:type II secretory pathway component PulL
MARSVGIDITADGIRLVQVSRRGGKLSVLSACARTAQQGESPEATVGAQTQDAASPLAEALREVKLKANATVVAGLPLEKVFFSRLGTELTEREDLRRRLQFELEDDFPLPFDDLVADICSRRGAGDDKYEYLIAAASRGQINASVQMVSGAGWRCSVLSTDVCALAAVARRVKPDDAGGPGIILHVDGGRAVLGLLQDGALACARHLACLGDADSIGATLAREIELTIRGTLGRQCRRPLRILLTGPAELVHELSTRLSQATGHEVVCCELSPISGPGAALDGQFAIALGFALIGLDSGDAELNFLSADLSQVDRAARSRAKRSVLVSAILLALILGLLGVGSFRRLRAMEAERADLTRAIRTVFVETFPGEKKVVNELAQMNEHVTALRKERDTLAAVMGKRIQPLQVLHLLSEKMTSDKAISISSFSVRDRIVRVTGTGGSFESVEQFLEELKQVPEFDSAALEDVALSRGSDRPEFRLVISLKAG